MEFCPVDDVSPMHIKKVQELIGRHYQAMTRLRQSMFRMLIGTHAPHLEHYLTFLDEAQADVSQYLQNELLGTLMRYDESAQKEVWDVIPENMRLDIHDRGFVISHIPKWMLGHGAKKKHSPLFRSDLPGLRKELVWQDVLSKMILEYRQRHPADLYRLQKLSEPDVYTKLIVVFRSRNSTDVRDLDHYLPMFEPLVNRLCGVLMNSDDPAHFSYAFEWKEDESSLDGGDFSIYGYISKTPFSSWSE